ncbi:chloride channel CLIC-like protein 1 isoform X2 [Folsomia candida]|uniref:chloride channel CLIC-like protein 1 isoform X2 n=1 Tax=Folsomia candida TaxID=158441 RepID=UPI000B8EF138|nr:chloride channel CLIC-like protein 1 isoform X2 [Folsomia candida]
MFWLLTFGVIVFILTLFPTFPLQTYCQDDYIDFTDMGSYDHGSQLNKIIDTSVEEHTKVSLAIRQDQIALVGIAVDNGSRPMKFLQRVVKSILRQMNVQSHTFGPGEAITIDLQAEIKYNDYVILNKFVNSEEQEESDKYLSKVDDVMSNLIHVVEHSSSRFDYAEYIFNLPIFSSLKFWLVLTTMSVVCFLIVMLSLRTIHAANNVSMLLYGFLIIFILSCIWTFSYMYEDAKATNYAKLVQAQNPPKDCEYENLSFRDSVSYFFRVQLFGYKDQCEQYYSTTMTDPFWSVNPLEAISQSFTVLVFAPFGYIGDKIGLFFKGIISGIPFWLQPLLVLLIFGFTFMSLFGYRVVSPLFTIEPARRGDNCGPAPSGSPAITDRIKNELVERPERKVMKSIRDAQTDMDGFENYLDGTDQAEMRSSRRPWLPLCIIFERISALWFFIVNLLDAILRQSPTGGEVPEPQDDNNEDNFNFGNEEIPIIPNPEPAAGPSPPLQQRIGIADVFIPRRRMHIGLEGSNVDKENLKPSCSNLHSSRMSTSHPSCDHRSRNNSSSSEDERDSEGK